MYHLLHQALPDRATANPHKTAVIFKNQNLSYRELERLSNGLAWELFRGGIKSGDRVGIYLDKSLQSMIAVFGILKAGATYVPLDPAAPPIRLAYIIQDCAIKALVTFAEGARNLSFKGHLVVPGEIAESDFAPPAEVAETDLAYILYTSGSTGRPKGVMISHRAALSFVNWACEYFGVEPDDRVSNHAPLHFDLSIFDLFACLQSGATVVLVPRELSLFPIELADFIHKQAITIWYSVPSALTRLILYGKPERYHLPSLRKILFAGEIFPLKYLRQLKELIPGANYYNLYGPTETNVCTVYPVDKASLHCIERIPIGKACAGAEVFALTDEGKPAKIGETGELYVRGPSLMEGYWGLPEKTKGVFIPDPLASPEISNKAPRVYRTGDLVVQDETGNYLFLGRRDEMIKSRGYRIELGEIEGVLVRHPQVEDVAAIAIPDEETGNLIKAVVVARKGCKLNADDVKRFCADYLPVYMMPGLIEFSSDLPRTSTGKIAKNCLLRQHLEENRNER
jgi:amino acid adenylation domain-containing protein